MFQWLASLPSTVGTQNTSLRKKKTYGTRDDDDGSGAAVNMEDDCADYTMDIVQRQP